MTTHTPLIRLISAKLARDTHASECPQWDHEGSDCLECQDLDNEVRKARRAWKAPSRE